MQAEFEVITVVTTRSRFFWSSQCFLWHPVVVSTAIYKAIFKIYFEFEKQDFQLGALTDLPQCNPNFQ